MTTDSTPTRRVVVQRTTPLSRFAATGAVGAAVGASVTAYVRSRRRRRTGPPRPQSEIANPMGEASAVKSPPADAKPGRAGRLVRRVDGLQQRHSWLGFPLAVVKKFGDDSAGNLAALIAYYGFLSLFPLLLALTTVLATALRGHAGLQQRVLDSALADFPVIGDQIRSNIHSLRGSVVALVIGVVGAVWGGMGVMKAAGQAMDDIWEVPKRQRPNFLRALIRAALLLLVLGGGIVATTILSGIGTAGTAGFIPLKIVGTVGAALIDIGLFVVGFRVLTVADVSVRNLVPGAVVAGLAWFVLQGIGGYYVTHQLAHASQTYGTFAIVIGLLSWLYIQAQLTLLGAEINVVRVAKLWPRGLTPPLTEADRRAFTAYAEVEERRPEEDVGVGFTGASEGADSDGEQERVVDLRAPSAPVGVDPPAPTTSSMPTGNAGRAEAAS